MSIHISCDMYLRLGLHVQIRLYYVLPYKEKISAQHGIGFILDRCIVYLGLTMPNLQKKRVLIFEIFNFKKCTLFFGNPVYLQITLTEQNNICTDIIAYDNGHVHILVQKDVDVLKKKFQVQMSLKKFKMTIWMYVTSPLIGPSMSKAAKALIL